MKKILVPVDFSDLSENALGFAIDLAEKIGADITLLHSIHSEYLHDFKYGFYTEMQTLEDEIKETANKRMDEFASRFHTNVRIEKRLTPISLVIAVKDLVDEERFGLVVVGTHGSSGMEELFIGSNTERIVRHTSCPVIAVPGRVRSAEIKKILVPLDIREIRDSFLAQIAKLQRLFGCKLEFVWVKTPHNIENEDMMKEELLHIFKAHGLSNYEFQIVRTIFPSDGIFEEAIDSKADMLAMATHARRGISHWLSGSLTEDTINHVKMPVWSFKIHKEEKPLVLDAVAKARGIPPYKNLDVVL